PALGKPRDRPQHGNHDQPDADESARPDELQRERDERGAHEPARNDRAGIEDRELRAAEAGRIDDEADDDEDDADERQQRIDCDRKDHREGPARTRATVHSRIVSEYVISSDLHAIDRDVVFRFLHEDAYWSAGLPRDVFDRSLESSLCFSAFAGKHGPQVGFARVVSDRATFGGSANAAPAADQKNDCSTLAHTRNDLVHKLHDSYMGFREQVKVLAHDARELARDESHSKSATNVMSELRSALADSRAKLQDI